jgi:hypothetical protein
LLVPIILFLLGLPNKGPEAKETPMEVDKSRREAEEYVSVIGYAGQIGFAMLTPGQFDGLLAGLYLGEGEVRVVDFKELLDAGSRPALVEEFKRNPTVRVRGQFARSPGSDNVFALVRFKIGCCGADAIAIPIPVVSRESLAGRTDLKRNDWVNVTGVVEFMEEAGTLKPLIRVNSARKIEHCKADSRPYIQ